MTLYRLYALLVLCAIAAVELLVHWPRTVPEKTYLQTACEKPADEMARNTCSEVSAGLPGPR